MKEKTIKYDDVITYYNGVPFNHGIIEYAPCMNRKDESEIEFLSTKINVAFALSPNNREAFVREFTNLISRYGV